jgi:A/G-specific adenine glycosylase
MDASVEALPAPYDSARACIDAELICASVAPERIAPALLAWYRRHARVLPWRRRPGEGADGAADGAYRVWLSEVMLQQTTVAAVIPYFERFVRAWPSVSALAAADDAAVMAAWAGLGYYARARNLLACARVVVAEHGGRFPDTEAALRALPGLGAYTAAAVAAIAFGRRAVVVDANVERVVSRLFAIAEPLPGARAAIRTAADAITPERDAGDFAQAMMDLGSSVCTPRQPRCLGCPLSASCAARMTGDPEAYPVKPAKRARPQRSGRAWWITREGAQGREVLLVRRRPGGMLGGMRALPDDAWSAKGDGAGPPPFAADWRVLGSVDHGFTHFQLGLAVCAHTGEPVGLPIDGEWWPLARIDDAGLPTLFARAAQMAMAMNEGDTMPANQNRKPRT